jgi:hypothetical protein
MRGGAFRELYIPVISIISNLESLIDWMEINFYALCFMWATSNIL